MSKQKSDPSKYDASTLAALLEEKPKRGRPRHSVSRQTVYVALRTDEKEQMKALAKRLPAGLSRADVADLAVTMLAARLEALRRAVAGRDREIPEGVTDMVSLYLLWDLPLPPRESDERWTSLRLSPREVIELGRVQGMLNAAFGANRSETFSLALALLAPFLEQGGLAKTEATLEEIRRLIQETV
jgi:hypothetical protein